MSKFIMASKAGLILLLAAVMSACGTASSASTPSPAATAAVATAVTGGTASDVQLASVKAADLVSFDEEDVAADWSADSATMIALSGTSSTVTGSGAVASGSTVTISAGGTYVLSGTLSDGQIIIDVQDDSSVHLVLNGATLTNSSSAPVYIKEAGKVIMTLEDGTVNTVTDGANYVYPDAATDEPSAAIFSKADLTINGTGTLKVNGNYNDGITSKDDLKIVSGTIEVKAADDGLVGKDLVAVQDGSITITAEGDGIKSTNDEDTEKGFIAIFGGSFDITAANDGIQGETSLVIDGGTYNLVTGGGSESAEVKTGDEGGFGGGGFGGGGMGGGGMRGQAPSADGTQAAPPEMPAGDAAAGQGTPPEMPADDAAASTDTATATETESVSMKGLKSGGDLTVNGGSFTIDSADDAVHSNSSISVTGGEFQIETGDDGIHADSLTAISGGTINITKSYEGIEGANITISGGDIDVAASDDGVNVAGGNDTNAGQTAGGQDQFASAGSNMLTITGGTLTVDASGDGLDSNGSITMSGGTVTVYGPTNDGNGALDFDGTFEMTGGYLIAAGSAGMLQAPGDASSQYSIAMTFTDSQEAGQLVNLKDKDGNTIATFAPAKSYRAVVISSPDLKEGGTYTLSTGGSSTGTAVDGVYTDGTYSGGTEVVSFDLSSSVTWLNESGVTEAAQGMGGMGGGRGQGGFGGGTRPDRGTAGGTPPTGTPPTGAPSAGTGGTTQSGTGSESQM
ncbi:carbohydrate-binding domain-containing protein [Paenibacillus sp. FSL R7-0273]|uniref:carbohydrate-binding domain-containing protein n=1 Tax=Paenibacillus sp. FSL R7-0273 TaxID=1536772 RepID=UPI00063EE1B4|nr:carbohydrate-binding domain-containing protein [Paenibacillus sp. FSL R7-0273]OMF84539.1 dockerin type 1 [Paenibacillus sp. FSL R7-0273]